MNRLIKRYNIISDFWAIASPKRKRRVYIGLYTTIFAVAFLLAYSPFILAGKSFIWVLDGKEQHFPTLIYIGRWLRETAGNIFSGRFELPLFDIKLAWGGDVISSLNYYGFGDPLYLTSAFVPSAYTEYLYYALIIVRLYLSGLAFSALCFYRKKNAGAVLCGALIYVFSGYAVFSAVRHPYFINPMIQLPLLILGANMIMKKKKPLVFVLTVFYSALCGFYFLFIMTVMLAAYVLAVFFTKKHEKIWKEFFATCLRVIGYYLIGIGLAAFIFLPATLGFLTCGRFGQSVTRNYFFYAADYYLSNFTKLIAPSGGWNSLALAAIVFPALVLFIGSKKKHYRSIKILLAAALAFYVLPLGGYIMNGFGYPTQRWTFGAALLLSYIVVEMLPTLISLDKKQSRIVIIASAVYIIPTLTTFIVFEIIDFGVKELYLEAGFVFLAVTTAALLIISGKLKLADKTAMRRLGTALCAFVIFVNTVTYALYLFSENKTNYVKDFDEHGVRTETLADSPENFAANHADTVKGRVDSSVFTVNTGAVCDIPTLYSYWSITNAGVVSTAIRSEALFENCSSITGVGGNAALSSLLSVKYVVEPEDRPGYVPFGYKEIAHEDGFALYENEFALPWGYTYDTYIEADDFEKLSGVAASSSMLRTIALDEAPDGIEKATVTNESSKINYKVGAMSGVTWQDGALEVNSKGAWMVLECTLPASSESFVRLCGLDIGRDRQIAQITVQTENVERTEIATGPKYNWYFGRENYLFDLGYSKTERKNCIIRFAEAGKYTLDNIEVISMPMHRYAEHISERRKEPLENIEWGTNALRGTVDLSKDKVLCVSIPYSKGWSAKVDGEEAKILVGNGMFMALPLEKGEHTVEFRYRTPGLTAGIAISLVSLAALIIVVKGRFFLERKKQRTLP